MEKKLQVGFHKEVITPPNGTYIPGYYFDRFGEGTINDLYVQVTAFDNGEKKAIFATFDALGVPYNGYLAVRKALVEKFGLDENSIILHASHSHTAFHVLAPIEGKDNLEETRKKWLIHKTCDCTQRALEDLKPATIKMAKSETTGIAFSRRYLMKDGSYQTGPKRLDPNIVAFAEEQDNSLQLLRIEREGGCEILFVNFGTHADTVSGNLYCSDWPGFTREILSAALGQGTEVMMLVGPQGDSSVINRFTPQISFKMSVSLAKRTARMLSGEVLKIYSDATPVPCDNIHFTNKIVHVGINPYDPEDIPEAKQVMKAFYESGNDFSAPSLKNFKLNVVESRRMINLHDAKTTGHDLQVSLLQIGNIAFVGFPGEPFMAIGRAVKEKSHMDMTFCTCCTNGSQGYFPSAAAFEQKGYERNSSPFAHNVAEVLTSTALDLIKPLELQSKD